MLNAFREVEDGLSTEAALRRQREYLSTALDLSRQSELAARERLEDGAIDATLYLAAQRASLNAENRVLDLEVAALNNRIALALALGGSPMAPPPEVDSDADPEVADATPQKEPEAVAATDATAE